MIISALLNTFHPFSPSPTSLPPSTLSWYSFVKSVLWFTSLSFSPPSHMFICFVSYIPHINKIVWYLSFSDVFSLASYTLAISMFLQMARFHSFEWLSNIPLCVYTHTHTHAHTHTHTHTYISHIFIHLSVNGHLGSFHTLTIVDNVAINIKVNIPLQIYIFVSFG